jgi:phospholipid/cholesterol/gamma-HCH transport system ATP-binding protein
MQAQTATPDTPTMAIEMQGVVTRFGSHVVHNGIDLSVRKAEVFAVIGGSGSGKSTLLREMILLQKPSAGEVRVLDTALRGIDDAAALALRLRFGVLFQHGGLFGSLTVLENIGLPLREHRKMDDTEIDKIAFAKLEAVGLDAAVADQLPSELSGGMLKRAALARALVLDPELLFLDEPTAGLDPQSAAGIDELVRSLRDTLDLTVVMITHDLDSLWQVADRVAVLADGRVQDVGAMAQLAKSEKPAVRAFFEGPRARTAQTQAETQAKMQATVPAGEASSKPK